MSQTLKVSILNRAVAEVVGMPRRQERTPQQERRAKELARVNVLMAKSEGYVGTGRRKR